MAIVVVVSSKKNCCFPRFETLVEHWSLVEELVEAGEWPCYSVPHANAVAICADGGSHHREPELHVPVKTNGKRVRHRGNCDGTPEQREQCASFGAKIEWLLKMASSKLMEKILTGGIEFISVLSACDRASIDVQLVSGYVGEGL
jgi:hypothetical protein